MRGNGQIIQELEAAFRGAGWNCIKVLWGTEWDPILERDTEGLLVKRMGELVDGEYQKLVVESGAYVRAAFLRHRPAPAASWSSHSPTRRCAACVSAATIRARSTPRTRPPSNTRAVRRSSSRARSRAMAWAKPAKARTSRTSRKNSTKTSCAFSARASTFLSTIERLHRRAVLSPRRKIAPEIQYLRARREALGGYTPARKVRVEAAGRRPRRTLQGISTTAARAAKSRRRWRSSACCAKC